MCDNGCGFEYEKPADPTPDTSEKPEEDDDEKTETPATGDNTNITIWVVIFVISALGIVATIILGKKRLFVK